MMAESTPGKLQLRTELRQRRRDLDSSHRKAVARLIASLAQTLPDWATSQRIAMYRDINDEVRSAELIEACLAQGKNLYLPVACEGNKLEFARWAHGEQLRDNRFGIAEPIPTAERCPAAELDILFLPLVGWDRAGNRLGMGGGYYDRTLRSVSGPLLVGVAYCVQEVDDVPRESWDVALDIVLTEAGIHICPGGGARHLALDDNASL